MIKFSTDGAVLTRKRMGVQGTIKLIDLDPDGKPNLPSTLPDYMQKEICVYYYIGQGESIYVYHLCSLFQI